MVKKISTKTLITLLLTALFIIVLITPKEIIKEPSIIGAVITKVYILINLPPAFDHNLTDQVVNESSQFLYDINCSDNVDEVDYDVVRYYDNVSKFEINDSTGLINWTPVQDDVGNNSITITCSDGVYNTSQTFVITVLDTNNPPILSSIGPQIAAEGQLFTLYIYSIDPDYDNLTFNTSTTLFTILTVNDSGLNAIGLINFTPAFSQIGNHTINVSVSDGFLSDFEIIQFRIVRGYYCGDGYCNGDETCATCSEDCGVCPAPPPAEAPAVEKALGRAPYYVCKEKWECSEWSKCIPEGVQTRKCIDINKCGTTKDKPSEIQSCTYIPTCDDGIKNCHIMPNGTVLCEEGVDCGGPCIPCITPNCFDGIQNCHTMPNGTIICEEGVDCGGPCTPCEVKEYIKLPFIEKPLMIEKLKRYFPWLFVLLILILIAVTVTGDQVYVRYISKKEFEEYRKKIRRYKKIRKKIYKFIINLLLITFIISIYVYLFSTNIEDMKKYIWIPITLIMLTPIVVSIIIRHYIYYEYLRKKKEEILLQTHNKQIRQFIKTEDELLFEIEKKIRNKIYDLAKNRKLDNFAGFYNELKQLYGGLTNLQKSRDEVLKLFERNKDIENKISVLVINKTLINTAKEYPEFRSILDNLKLLEKNKEKDFFIIEENLLAGIREISMPHLMGIIKSDSELIFVYNTLVDLYEFYGGRHSGIELKEEQIAENEKLFCKKAEKIIGNEVMIEAIRSNPDIVFVYNNLVELYSHYNKKQELYNRMKRLKRRALDEEKPLP